jgi:hypothetical protein
VARYFVLSNPASVVAILLTILGWANPFTWMAKLRLLVARGSESILTRLRSIMSARWWTSGEYARDSAMQWLRTKAKKLLAVAEEGLLRFSDGRKMIHIFMKPTSWCLKWAHEMDFEPRDIKPDIPRRLDLCYATEGAFAERIRFSPARNPEVTKRTFRQVPTERPFESTGTDLARKMESLMSISSGHGLVSRSRQVG